MLSFVRRSRRVAVSFFTVLGLSTVSFNFDVLLPLLARQTLEADADVFGLIAAVFGAGALCGALFLATIGKASLRLLLAGALGFGVLELALAPQRELVAVCALLFLIGVFYVLWGSSALASLQLAAPTHLRGQAASLYFFAFQGGAPLGGLLAGWLTSRGGTVLAFSVAGASAIAVALAGAATLLQPGWSRLHRWPVLVGHRRHDLGGEGDVGIVDQAVRDEADPARVALEAQDAALGQ